MDKIISIDEFEKMSDDKRDSFIGITESSQSYVYRMNGKFHREFGPAYVSKSGALVEFYLDDLEYDEDMYWKEMYRRFKGTDKEDVVLSHILGKK